MKKGRNFDYPKPVRGKMAKAALWQMEEDAKTLRAALRDDDALPGWVDLYLATSADRLGTASKYMQYQIKFQPASAADLASADLAGADTSASDLEGWWEDYAPQILQDSASGWSQGASYAKDVIQKEIAPQLPAPAAQAAGAKVPPSVYSTVPVQLKEVPKSTATAYAVALYWLNLAIMRANYDKNTTAVGQLTGYYAALHSEAPSVTDAGPMDLLCASVGIGCKRKGRAEVINYAYNAINASTLATSDKDIILPILRSVWRKVKVQEVAPLVLVGVGAATAVWFLKRKKA